MTAPQFPETSVKGDVARLRQVLVRQKGPTIVVGHFYGGSLMTSLGKDALNVVGLIRGIFMMEVYPSVAWSHLDRSLHEDSLLRRALPGIYSATIYAAYLALSAINFLTDWQCDWQSIFARSQRTEPARIVGAGWVIGIIEIDHQAIIFMSQIGVLNRIQ